MSGKNPVDPDWLRTVEEAGKAHVRGIKRRAFWRRNQGRFIALAVAVALVATGTTLYFTGALKDYLPSGQSSEGPQVNLAQPFLGTEADTWADGAAGFVAPEAKPVGKYSAKQVRELGERVRQFLITSRLDRQVIEKGETDRVFKLLAPDAKSEFTASVNDKSSDASFLYTRISPDYRLLPVDPKVTGSMSFSVNAEGELVARTNFSIAYAFDPGNSVRITDPHDIIAVERWEGAWIVHDGTQWRKNSRGLWWEGRATGYHFMVNCTEWAKDYLAPSYRDQQQSADGTEVQKNAFDPKIPMSQLKTTCKR